MQSQNDRDLLAAILLKRDEGGHESWDTFHANLSQAVLDSDWLASRDADKWDEGFARGFYSAQTMRSGSDASESPAQNPYRGGGDQ